MIPWRGAFFVSLLALSATLPACTTKQASAPRETTAPAGSTSTNSPSAASAAELVHDPKAPDPKAPDPNAPDPKAPDPKEPRSAREAYVEWLRTKLPKRGRVVDAPGEPVKVVHVGEQGEKPLSIARAYLDLATVYTPLDYYEELLRENPALRRGIVTDGMEIAIPKIVDAPFATGESTRLGWPEDKVVRGVFLRNDGGAKFPALLDKLTARGLNTIVLDGKDYEGYVTYPTKVPLALETKADKNAPMFSLARVVRWAHAKGIRIVMRNSCFHDPWTAKTRPDLSVQSKWGKPYPLQWVDPQNEVVQSYIVDVIKEQLAAGVDEIQLDYIRYPVQGIEGADFHLEEKGLTPGKVVYEFVKRVHALTKEHGVPLSLDIFGVVAFNRPEDVTPLGQDVKVLASECEVLSPMVYPSHFAHGFRGFAEPGDHPEVVGIGTRATVEQIRQAGLSTLVRPWLQAFPMRSPSFGPKYVAEEVKSAEAAGGTGWLLWHPGGDYGTSFQAFPANKSARAVP